MRGSRRLCQRGSNIASVVFLVDGVGGGGRIQIPLFKWLFSGVPLNAVSVAFWFLGDPDQYCGWVIPRYTITLENHCTRTAQSSRGGCSRRVHKIVYIAVSKGNILVWKYPSRIIITYNIHLAVYLLNKNVGWMIVARASALCQKIDFFSEIEDERNYCYCPGTMNFSWYRDNHHKIDWLLYSQDSFTFLFATVFNINEPERQPNAKLTLPHGKIIRVIVPLFWFTKGFFLFQYKVCLTIIPTQGILFTVGYIFSKYVHCDIRFLVEN